MLAFKTAGAEAALYRCIKSEAFVVADIKAMPLNLNFYNLR